MLKFKKYFIFTGIIIFFYILVSLLYLFTNISYNVISSLILIFNLIVFIVLGYIYAKRSSKKGITVGFKVSSIIIILLFSLSFIFKYQFNIKNIIYYLLIVLSTTFGSIISKNINASIAFILLF